MHRLIQHIKKIIFVVFTLVAATAFATPTTHTATINTYNNIQTNVLHGSHYEMGVEYGQAMQQQMQKTLSILEDFYIAQHALTHDALVKQASLLYNRFPVSYQKLIQGAADGAKISLDDEIILNGMETLGELLHTQGHCAFIAVPAAKSATGAMLIGRNYDYPAPFDQIAPNLAVTVMQEDNSIPTAFISLPGELYCPSCVNANGLFMELNNGSPSGGGTVDTDRQSLLANMLQIMQNSSDLAQLQKQLNATQSDFSLIVNTADETQAKSFEFSSTLGMKQNFPDNSQPYVSTNYYQSPDWSGLPTPTDASTWMGITRHDNLLNLVNSSPDKISITSFEDIMDKDISNGGGKWDITIYQIIFNPQNLNLYLQAKGQTSWSEIPLKKTLQNLSFPSMTSHVVIATYK